MNTCGWLVVGEHTKLIGTCGKPSVGLAGRLEVCAEHMKQREEKQVRKRGPEKQSRITKIEDLD